jgi:hypothetical protein
VVAPAVALALSAAPARAELTAQTLADVTARMAPPVFVATATGPPLGTTFARVSASPAVDAQGVLGNEKADEFMTQQSPGVYVATAPQVSAWWTPGTLYWQALDYSCLSTRRTGCTSQVVPFHVQPLPPPVMVSPADGAQIRSGTILSGTKVDLTIRDVPSYFGARSLFAEFSLSPRLASSGRFAEPVSGFPWSAPSWQGPASTSADGTGTAQAVLDSNPGLFHKRIYWHVYRLGCFAERPECVASDGQVRSVIITPVPDRYDPTANPDTRVLFRSGLKWPNQPLLHRPKAKILIGYVILKASHAKRSVGDLQFALNVRATPFGGTMRVTIRLDGRTRVLHRKRFDIPGGPEKLWRGTDILERVNLSKRMRAAIIAALERHQRVPITGTLTTTDLLGRPERHVTHDHYTLSLPQR